MVCQQNNEILSGDGQNKFARGDFSSLQFFRFPTLAVDLFRSAAKRIPTLSFFQIGIVNWVAFGFYTADHNMLTAKHLDLRLRK
jgi:hypothetical protein